MNIQHPNTFVMKVHDTGNSSFNFIAIYLYSCSGVLSLLGLMGVFTDRIYGMDVVDGWLMLLFSFGFMLLVYLFLNKLIGNEEVVISASSIIIRSKRGKVYKTFNRNQIQYIALIKVDPSHAGPKIQILPSHTVPEKNKKLSFTMFYVEARDLSKGQILKPVMRDSLTMVFQYNKAAYDYLKKELGEKFIQTDNL